jgi:hypothetical protein
VAHPENPLDKQIAAMALIHDLVLVTRNVKHFAVTGVKPINPFSQREESSWVDELPRHPQEPI